ncbi:PREDICTED: arrestin domain-containing protein 3-like, partial [Priapulus caudatus]|uniref:Arrestin domain-containing protein 3-like n=1 Tax=Priapulus caudatus TaxID=37621 RepID=A0ABM1F6W7_PRICU
IRVQLRGKAHAEWKVTRSGERRSTKDDQNFLDQKAIIWGRDKTEEVGNIPILLKGNHRISFNFPLPETSLPGSFESRLGTVRYWIKAVLDIPYASPPQGMKYFTIIGPYIDCMDERYL